MSLIIKFLVLKTAISSIACLILPVNSLRHIFLARLDPARISISALLETWTKP